MNTKRPYTVLAALLRASILPTLTFAPTTRSSPGALATLRQYVERAADRIGLNELEYEHAYPAISTPLRISVCWHYRQAAHTGGRRVGDCRPF